MPYIEPPFRPDYTIDETAFAQLKAYQKIADFPEDLATASAGPTKPASLSPPQSMSIKWSIQMPISNEHATF